MTLDTETSSECDGNLKEIGPPPRTVGPKQGRSGPSVGHLARASRASSKYRVGHVLKEPLLRGSLLARQEKCPNKSGSPGCEQPEELRIGSCNLSESGSGSFLYRSFWTVQPMNDWPSGRWQRRVATRFKLGQPNDCSNGDDNSHRAGPAELTMAAARGKSPRACSAE